MHKAPLRGQHMRVLFLCLRGALRACKRRAVGARHGLREPLRVRGRGELVGFGEGDGRRGGRGGLGGWGRLGGRGGRLFGGWRGFLGGVAALRWERGAPEGGEAKAGGGGEEEARGGQGGGHGD